jgi:hypothetical protein
MQEFGSTLHDSLTTEALSLNFSVFKEFHFPSVPGNVDDDHESVSYAINLVRDAVVVELRQEVKQGSERFCHL